MKTFAEGAPHRALLIVAVVWAVVLLAASTRSAAAGNAKETADTLYRAGVQALEGGDEATALDDFERAEVLYRHPKIALARAMVLTRMGLPAEAAELLDAALAGELRPELRSLAESERGKLDAVLLRLTVDGDAPTEASIDGAAFRAVPTERWVAPGLHTVRARGPGRLPFEADVIGAAGEHQTVIAHSLLAAPLLLPDEPVPRPLPFALPEEPVARPARGATWYLWVTAGVVVAGAAVVFAMARSTPSPHASTDLGQAALVFH